MTKKAVIIGGGISGIYAMRNLLEKRGALKEEFNITLIKRENTGWVSVCGLPYALRGWYEIDKVVINDPKFFPDTCVDFTTEADVVQITT